MSAVSEESDFEENEANTFDDEMSVGVGGADGEGDDDDDDDDDEAHVSPMPLQEMEPETTGDLYDDMCTVVRSITDARYRRTVEEWRLDTAPGAMADSEQLRFHDLEKVYAYLHRYNGPRHEQLNVLIVREVLMRLLGTYGYSHAATDPIPEYLRRVMTMFQVDDIPANSWNELRRQLSSIAESMTIFAKAVHMITGNLERMHKADSISYKFGCATNRLLAIVGHLLHMVGKGHSAATMAGDYQPIDMPLGLRAQMTQGTQGQEAPMLLSTLSIIMEANEVYVHADDKGREVMYKNQQYCTMDDNGRRVLFDTHCPVPLLLHGMPVNFEGFIHIICNNQTTGYQEMIMDPSVAGVAETIKLILDPTDVHYFSSKIWREQRIPAKDAPDNKDHAPGSALTAILLKRLRSSLSVPTLPKRDKRMRVLTFANGILVLAWSKTMAAKCNGGSILPRFYPFDGPEPPHMLISDHFVTTGNDNKPMYLPYYQFADFIENIKMPDGMPDYSRLEEFSFVDGKTEDAEGNPIITEGFKGLYSLLKEAQHWPPAAIVYNCMWMVGMGLLPMVSAMHAFTFLYGRSKAGKTAFMEAWMQFLDQSQICELPLPPDPTFPFQDLYDAVDPRFLFTSDVPKVTNVSGTLLYNFIDRTRFGVKVPVRLKGNLRVIIPANWFMAANVIPDMICNNPQGGAQSAGFRRGCFFPFQQSAKHPNGARNQKEMGENMGSALLLGLYEYYRPKNYDLWQQGVIEEIEPQFLQTFREQLRRQYDDILVILYNKSHIELNHECPDTYVLFNDLMNHIRNQAKTMNKNLVILDTSVEDTLREVLKLVVKSDKKAYPIDSGTMREGKFILGMRLLSRDDVVNHHNTLAQFFSQCLEAPKPYYQLCLSVDALTNITLVDDAFAAFCTGKGVPASTIIITDELVMEEALTKANAAYNPDARSRFLSYQLHNDDGHYGPYIGGITVMSVLMAILLTYLYDCIIEYPSDAEDHINLQLDEDQSVCVSKLFVAMNKYMKIVYGTMYATQKYKYGVEMHDEISRTLAMFTSRYASVSGAQPNFVPTLRQAPHQANKDGMPIIRIYGIGLHEKNNAPPPPLRTARDIQMDNLQRSLENVNNDQSDDDGGSNSDDGANDHGKRAMSTQGQRGSSSNRSRTSSASSSANDHGTRAMSTQGQRGSSNKRSRTSNASSSATTTSVQPAMPW